MKRIGKVLLFGTLLFIMLFGLNNQGVFAKANYTITPKDLTKIVKDETPGFYNKFVKDYAGLNIYLEKIEDAGGGTLTIKKGTYKISNSIYVPSNVKIIFEDGVVFKKIFKTGKKDLKPTTAMWQLCPKSKSKKKASIGKYKGTKNAKFIAKGDVVFDMKNTEGGVCIIAAHNKNIEVSGITFKGMNGGHYIELNGTQKAYIHDCTFGKGNSKKIADYYMKEAINIDLADSKLGGLSATWVKQDKTPCTNITIENNTFDGTGRGVGTHKHSQNSKEEPIYHQNIVIKNNEFKNNYDNGIYVLTWKNTTIKDNTFYNIGNTSNKTYSAGNHAIAGGGIIQINITGNTFEKINRNPVYFITEKNVGSGSEYKPVNVNITEAETEAMKDNVVINCGNDVNENYSGYDILYFRNDGTKTRENGVGIKLETGEIFYGIPKN